MPIDAVSTIMGMGGTSMLASRYGRSKFFSIVSRLLGECSPNNEKSCIDAFFLLRMALDGTFFYSYEVKNSAKIMSIVIEQALEFINVTNNIPVLRSLATISNTKHAYLYMTLMSRNLRRTRIVPTTFVGWMAVVMKAIRDIYEYEEDGVSSIYDLAEIAAKISYIYGFSNKAMDVAVYEPSINAFKNIANNAPQMDEVVSNSLLWYDKFLREQKVVSEETRACTVVALNATGIRKYDVSRTAPILKNVIYTVLNHSDEHTRDTIYRSLLI